MGGFPDIWAWFLGSCALQAQFGPWSIFGPVPNEPGLMAPAQYVLREFACLTTVILASGAENLGSELPVVHHFARIGFIGFIRFIRLRIPSGSQTVKNAMILAHFLGKWVPESDQLLGGPPGHPKAPLGTPEPLQGQFCHPKTDLDLIWGFVIRLCPKSLDLAPGL